MLEHGYDDHEAFNKRSQSKDDIQIVQYEEVPRDPESRRVVCVHYANNKLTIYDPLYRNGKTLNTNLGTILRKLYPFVWSDDGSRPPRIAFVRPGTLQPDDVSSGLLAIAYATALMFNIDPKDLKLRLASSGDPVFFLKQHLEQIFHQWRITLFPRDLLKLTVSEEIRR